MISNKFSLISTKENFSKNFTMSFFVLKQRCIAKNACTYNSRRCSHRSALRAEQLLSISLFPEKLYGSLGISNREASRQKTSIFQKSRGLILVALEMHCAEAIVQAPKKLKFN